MCPTVTLPPVASFSLSTAFYASDRAAASNSSLTAARVPPGGCNTKCKGVLQLPFTAYPTYAPASNNRWISSGSAPWDTATWSGAKPWSSGELTARASSTFCSSTVAAAVAYSRHATCSGVVAPSRTRGT